MLKQLSIIACAPLPNRTSTLETSSDRRAVSVCYLSLHGSNFDRVLSTDPLEQIQAMHTHVDERAATAQSRIISPRLWIRRVPAVQLSSGQNDLPPSSGLDELARLRMLCVEHMQYAGIRLTPASTAVRRIPAASTVVRQSGFSQRTCFPA